MFLKILSKIPNGYNGVNFINILRLAAAFAAIIFQKNYKAKNVSREKLCKKNTFVRKRLEENVDKNDTWFPVHLTQSIIQDTIYNAYHLELTSSNAFKVLTYDYKRVR